jgi:hypothetical protein
MKLTNYQQHVRIYKMKISHLLVHLIMVCVSVFIYGHLTGTSFEESAGHSYWLLFGGLFTWFKMKEAPVK